MIIYKYTSIIDSFFTSPTLKLSQVEYLNDPFESMISKDAIKQSLLYFEKTMGSRKNSLIAKLLHQQSIPNNFSKKAIVSFSETQRNLLMWAHYANNHNGMVVGYRSDVLDKIDSLYGRETHSTMPKKVNYDTMRYDNEKMMVLEKYSSNDPHVLMKEIETMLLTTKGDEWIYEKEHRVITNLANFNTLRVKSDIVQKYLPKGLVSDFINTELSNDEWHIYDISDMKTNVSKHIAEIITKNKIDECNCIFLRRIKPEKIHSIYFGHRVSKAYVDKIKADISRESHILNHVMVEHFTISQDMYSLVKRTD